MLAASPNQPAAAPIIISNYNKKKSLEITINELETIKYRIDEPIMNYMLKDKSLIVCSSRVSGTIRIIEINLNKENGNADENKLSRDEQKV